jgi:hypothetical protein
MQVLDFPTFSNNGVGAGVNWRAEYFQALGWCPGQDGR